MAIALYGAGLNHSLLEPEEARYAEIPRQMLLHGRVLTPLLHGEDYWQKPPLLYWLIMSSYRIFGVHDWAARLIPCGASILSIAITTAWGWRTLGFWSGLISGTVLTLSARFVYLSGMLTMDSILCCSVLTGLATGHLALMEPGPRRRWCILTSASCGIGTLAKGPIAALLIAIPLLSFALLDRRSRFLSKTESFLSLGIYLTLTGPWFFYMACCAPDAAGSFLWLHHIKRFFSPFDHEKPFWFYVPSLLMGMLPWTILLIPMVPYLCRQSPGAKRRRPASLGIFTIAFLWCVVFFSFSGCKRPGYILPALPLMALILGTFLTHGIPRICWLSTCARLNSFAHKRGLQWCRVFASLISCMGLGMGFAAAIGQFCAWHEAATISCWFVFGLVVLLYGSAHWPLWVSWVGCVLSLFFVLFIAQCYYLAAYHERFGMRRLIELALKDEQEVNLPILSFPRRWDSISFYSRRGDISLYSESELESLMRNMQAHGKALLFTNHEKAPLAVSMMLPQCLEIEWATSPQSKFKVGWIHLRRN